MKTHTKIDVLDHGYVELVDSYGGDLHIVNAARVSFDQRSDEMGDKDRGLIRFLMREKHGTPFEMGSMMFRVQAPIVVFREWHRHRIGMSYNEMSGRYTVLPELWYVPAHEDVRVQVGKPGAYSYEPVNDFEYSSHIRSLIDTQAAAAFDDYKRMVEDGVAKEIARLVLPLSTYSKMVTQVNPRSLMNFLALRNHERAQKEIRMYAQALESIFAELFPITAEAFIEFGRSAP